MIKRGIISIFILIFLISFISADFEIGNKSHFIEQSYGIGSNIKGWINLSFDNQNSNSLFTDSFDNSIKLIDLLKQNSNINYNCSTKDCKKDYSSLNGENTLSFQINSNNNKLIGFRFNKKLTDIESVEFDITSNAQDSCVNQLKLDFFADNKFDIGNNKSTNNKCSITKTYGCFDKNAETNEYIIENLPNKHCQKIQLSESPGFEIGAYVKRGDNTGDIKMSLYNTYGEQISGATCILPKSPLQGEVSCKINYSLIKSQEYYVCIYSEKSGENSKIQGYSKEQGCGFNGQNFGEDNFAFNIFAQGTEFDNFGTKSINNKISENTLSAEIKDYIIDKYGSLDCSEKECIIPININSKVSQNIDLENLKIIYREEGGLTEENNFYEIEEISPKIDSDFIKIYLDKGNFTIPNITDEIDYSFELDNTEIFDIKINTQNIPEIKGIYPLNTASAYPTYFRVIVESDSNISEYKWNFGDNQTKSTSNNKITHIYNNTGNYNLVIEVKDINGGISSKSFEINVESPEKIIEKYLNNTQTNLENLNSQLDNYIDYEKEKLKQLINFEIKEDKLKQLKRDYASASTDEEYNSIMTDVLKYELPQNINLKNSGNSIIFQPFKNLIDISAIASITGEEYDYENKNAYQKAVSSWMAENIQTNIDFKEYEIIYKNSENSYINFFTIKTSEKTSLMSSPYLLIEKLDNLSFRDYYGEEQTSDYYYIELKNTENKFEFSSFENIDFVEESISLFISPELNELELEQSIITGPPLEDTSKWIKFILILLLLIVIGLIIYIILQEWYKRRYENYLFENRNNLYNLLLYIHNSKIKGLKDEEIRKNLEKAGWSGEQINYAMRKYYGKRTGMYEIIPVEIILSKVGLGTKQKIKRYDEKQKKENPKKGPNTIPRKRILK